MSTRLIVCWLTLAGFAFQPTSASAQATQGEGAKLAAVLLTDEFVREQAKLVADRVSAQVLPVIEAKLGRGFSDAGRVRFMETVAALYGTFAIETFTHDQRVSLIAGRFRESEIQRVSGLLTTPLVLKYLRSGNAVDGHYRTRLQARLCETLAKQDWYAASAARCPRMNELSPAEIREAYELAAAFDTAAMRRATRGAFLNQVANNLQQSFDAVKNSGKMPVGDEANWPTAKAATIASAAQLWDDDTLHRSLMAQAFAQQYSPEEVTELIKLTRDAVFQRLTQELPNVSTAISQRISEALRAPESLSRLAAELSYLGKDANTIAGWFAEASRSLLVSMPR
jgi:hypothetical protein